MVHELNDTVWLSLCSDGTGMCFVNFYVGKEICKSWDSKLMALPKRYVVQCLRCFQLANFRHSKRPVPKLKHTVCLCVVSCIVDCPTCVNEGRQWCQKKGKRRFLGSTN